MKIKNVFNLCKQNKHIYLFKENPDGDVVSQQWIGNGYATFLAEGFPHLNKDTLMAFFDVPESDRDGWNVHNQKFPTNICFLDNSPEEEMIETYGLPMLHGGKVLRTFYTSDGITFIDTDYLKPLADIKNVMEFYERRTKQGTLYIVVKAGFMIQAVIMPFNYLDETRFGELEAFFKGCKTAYKKQEIRDMSFTSSEVAHVDLNTGEILE